jgi:hypothetical protein
MDEDLGGIEWKSIRLTWTAPAADGGGTVTAYEVRRSASAINDGNWASATVCSGYPNPLTPKAPTSTETFTVTGLDRNTTYYFAVKSSGCDPALWSATANSVSATTRQSDLDVSDWWLYQIYYNSGDGTTNTVYQIENVRAVNQTATVNYNDMINPPAAFTSYTYSPCAIIDESIDEYKTSCTVTARQRKVYTYVTGFMVPTNAVNHMQDNELYVAADDPTLWLDVNQLPRAFSTTLGMGDGDIPTHQLFSYRDSAKPATTMQAPNTNDGYPFILAETDWPQWLWQDSIGTYIGQADIEMQKGYLWHVSSFNTGYNVANASTPAATGTFDVTYLWATNTYLQSFSSGSVTGGVKTPDADKLHIWYSEEVHSYFGYENWGLVNYESKDFGKSGFTVTDKTGAMDVSITITNILDYATSFNILLLIMDTNAATSAPTSCTGSNNAVYLNGKTVFPDVHTIASINSAIKNTGTLNPGASTTLTWTNIYTSDGGTYKVWCGGEQTSW